MALRIFFWYLVTMKGILIGVLVCVLFGLLPSCQHKGQQLDSKSGFALIPEPKGGEAVATYAGGCFWAMQECMIELKGVHKVISGYAGGNTVNPSYEQVLSKVTGHAEAVQVYYDPEVISFEQLSEAFFNSHDPTEVDRQGPDIGSDYRSIAFFRTKAEFETISRLVKKIDASRKYANPVATELLPFKTMYGAEMKHQDFYPNNLWDPYIRNVSRLKVLKLRAEMPGLIKSQYLN